MLSRFHLIPERYGRTDKQTDKQTDGQICYINIAHQYADARQKPTRPNGIENDASATHSNQTATSCDLGLWPPPPPNNNNYYYYYYKQRSLK